MLTREAARIAGVSEKVADYWARERGIAPTVNPRGSGRRRDYTFADIVGLRLAVRMRDARIPVDVIAAAVAHVRDRCASLQPSNARLSGAWLVVSSDGEQVAVVGDGAALPRGWNNRNSILHLVPLGKIVEDVSAKIRSARVTSRGGLPPARRPRGLAPGRPFR